MAKRRRWVRIDVTYERRSWITGLPGNARRLFPSFMIYLKKNGVRGGAERLDSNTMARELDCSTEDWNTFINAAVAAGAVIIDDDGDWFYVDWQDEQEVSTERVQRFREKQKAESE